MNVILQMRKQIFAIWEINDNQKNGLQKRLSEFGLNKKFLRRRFSGSGVDVDYSFRSMPLFPASRKRDKFTIIELFAENLEMAKPIYTKIEEWINSISDQYTVKSGVNWNLVKEKYIG